MTDLTPDAAMIASFRTRQPAFSDATKWPDSVVEQALCDGIMETNKRRWGVYKDECSNFRQRGIFLFAAHWLSLTYLTQAGATDPSNINSSARLNLSGKSVGDESVQYRITAMQDTGDDWLSTTHYGVQFYRLRRRAGIGAVAV